MKRVFLATGNAHKLHEMRALLEASPLAGRVSLESASVVGGMPAVEENAPDFEGNARLKAEALLRLCPSGTYALADDSGLEVTALGGAPGVFSARYAGVGATDAANVARLLAELRDVPVRTARFVCVLALVGGDGPPRCFTGTCAGTIAETLSGSGGFGYDPVFVPEGHTATFASLPPEVKAALSHRAVAFRRFAEAWSRA